MFKCRNAAHVTMHFCRISVLMSYTFVRENLLRVQERIAVAAHGAGRRAEEITLIAVSKSHPAEAIRAGYEAGQRYFGENRVQEWEGKRGGLADLNASWHLVGHLQSNKCRDAVELFEMIQSVDSLHVAQEINKRAEQAAKRMPILLEVNAVGEASKFGYRPEQLLAEFSQANALPRLEIQGLMTVPPWAPEPEKTRHVFRTLRELKQKCEEILGAPLPHLSMGMTGDFEVAIEEGATIVRIGTGLFGERKSKAELL